MPNARKAEAAERSARFIAELDAIDKMTPAECRAELRRMYRDQRAPSVLHAAAVATLARDTAREQDGRHFDGKPRNWCGRCEAGGCVVCTL